MKRQHTTLNVSVLFLLLSFLPLSKTMAQSILFDNVPPFGTGNTAVTNGGYVFNFSTTKAITLQNFRLVSSAATYTVTIWYNPVKVNGQPVIANMNAAGGWISLGSTSHTGLGTGAVATIPLNLNLDMNPGDTFAFFIQQSAGSVYPTTNTTTPIYSNGTVSIIADASSAFARSATTWFTPRQFNGGVIYVERSRPFNNASVSALISNKTFCGTTQDLRVKIANRGLNPISNVMVNWSIDGLLQTPVSLVTLLDTLNHPTNKNDTNITLGSISYTPGVSKNIYVWTSLPNGVTDTTTNDDSLNVILKPGLSGTYTISSTSADFTTFRGVTNAIDSFGKCGPVVFNVAAGEVFSNTPIILSNLDSITFQKFGIGANPIVYGLTGTGTTDAVFKISGSKTIVFDGIDVVDDASNTTTATQMEYGYAILNSSGTNGSSNNIIKNCRVTLKRSNTASFGILQSASTTGGGVAATALTGANHNNRYENVKIENVYKGIGLIGTPGFPDSNCIVTSTGGDTTIIGANTPNDIGNGTALVYGISAADQRNVEISKCLVRNLSITGSSTVAMQGIFIDNGSTTANYGTARVWGNTIFNVSRVSTSTTVSTATHVHGIRVDVSTTAAAQVWNNVVHSITSVASGAAVSANQMVRGISFGTTTGTGTADFYHNSVLINNPALNSTSVAFWKGGSGTAVVRNNIFANVSPAQTGVAKHYASYISVAPVITSNNVYWSPNANGFVGFAAAADRVTVAQFAAATSGTAPINGNDQGSANADPNFASATNLDFTSATPASAGGIAITTPFAITTDIAGNTRSTTAPSIGAYETIQPLFDSAAPVIQNVFAVNGSSPSVYATISDNSGTASIGNLQLWYRAGTSGPFTGVLPDSVPVGSMNGTYKWGASLASLPAGPYQYYIAARDIIGAGFNIAVNPIQAATFTNFSSTDPANYASNPDPAVNTRSFSKLSTLSAGTYSVGPTGTYAKLTNVAAALNTSELTGNVVFELQPAYDGTVGETFPITFNQFGTAGGNWTVTIRPASGATALQIAGSSTTAIIDLNGVKRLRFDGRPGGLGTTNELTVANTAVGPVFRFINDAQNDTLRYINMVDSNTSATSGIVFFSTTNAGTLASNGNSNNLIDRCSINGLSKTTNGIYSSGSTAPADNKNNTITNCNIFDFFSNTVASVNGILLEAGNSGWNIGTSGNGNNFYQTAVRNSTSTPALTIAVGFRAIQLNSTTVNGCSIIGNRIGGNIPGIPASTFVIGDNVGATNYPLHFIRAIDVVAAGTTTPVIIQDNTISDITLYTGLNNATAGAFSGINVLGGTVNTIGNSVGASTGTGSITLLYKNTTTSVNNYGIRYTGVSSGIIQNNSIGSMSADAAAGSIQLLCLYLSGTYTSPITVSNNTIGSLVTQHSIQSMSSSLAPVNVMGIVTSAATGAAISITNNTVMNLSSLCTNNGTANGLKGIYVTGASSVGSTVSGNTIRKLYSESNNIATDQSSAIIGINSNTSGAGSMVISENSISALVSGAGANAINIMGIYYASTSTATTNRIERNLIHSLYASASNASAVTLSGIQQGAGTTRLLIANNMIRLGLDSSGGNASGAHFITGIHKIAGSINTTLFNTVNIGGAGVANGVSNSYAYRSVGVGIDSLLNNIFINTRTNATTGGIHYAIGLASTTTLTINRNLYNASGLLGQFNNIDQATLVDWRSATTQDLQSVNASVNFVSNTDLHLTGASVGNTILTGVAIAGVTNDYDGQTRHPNFPYMGADEIPSSPLPVRLVDFTARKKQKDAVLTWSTASEVNASHYEVERSTDGKTFRYVKSVRAKGNTASIAQYSFTDESALEKTAVVYYRIKMIDSDGKYEYSKIVRVSDEEKNRRLSASIFPNPFSSTLTVSLDAETEGLLTAEVKDLAGKTLIILTQQIEAGNNTITLDNLSELKAGLYFLSITNGSKQQSIKVIKL